MDTRSSLVSMSREPAIRAELYRVLKNSIERDISFGDSRISGLAVEYPIDGKKADLVVFYQYNLLPAEYAFLIIETKGRRKYPATPLAKATRQAMKYAEKLNSIFFAVYDGWNFLLFEMSRPYLIKLSNFLRIDESIARNLLLGLLEFRQKRYEAESLEGLPKVADGWSFWQTILPSIAKSLASITTPELPEAWKRLNGQWFPIIDRDGEW